MWDDIEADPATRVTVDLVERQVRWSGEVHDFALDDYTRWRLMEGLDDIGLTLRHTDAVDAYEARPQAVAALREQPDRAANTLRNRGNPRRHTQISLLCGRRTS